MCDFGPPQAKFWVFEGTKTQKTGVFWPAAGENFWPILDYKNTPPLLGTKIFKGGGILIWNNPDVKHSSSLLDDFENRYFQPMFVNFR